MAALTDWDIFRIASQALISGANPYSVGLGEMRFYNPACFLLPILPLAALPPLTGLVANAIVSTLALLVMTRRLGLSISESFLALISPMHLQSMVYGNPNGSPSSAFSCRRPWRSCAT